MDLLEGMITTKRTRNGSQLTKNCVKTFNPITIPTDKLLSSEVVEITNILTMHIADMKLLKEQGNIDEVRYVQPKSKELVTTILSFYFPHVLSKIIVASKTEEYEKTQYATVLIADDGEKIPVKGETDITILYCGVPVAVWEDKNLNKELKTPDEIGQSLAETKANAMTFVKSISLEAPTFCGILSTGLLWSLTTRRYHEGLENYFCTEPTSDLDKAAGLLVQYLRSIQGLMLLVDKSIESLLLSALLAPEDSSREEKDDEDSYHSGMYHSGS